MKQFHRVALLAAALFGVIAAADIANAGGSSIGGGLHYLRNLADIKDDSNIEWDNNSFGIIGSYQYDAGLLKLEGDVEYVFDYAGTGEAMWIPSAWALVGGMIYGGAGIGVGNLDGEWQDEPFYALRAGVNLPLGSMGVDVFGTYQFQNDEEFEDLTGESLDSVTFGAVLRFKLGG